jgi:hypothetical protein
MVAAVRRQWRAAKGGGRDQDPGIRESGGGAHGM